MVASWVKGKAGVGVKAFNRPRECERGRASQSDFAVKTFLGGEMATGFPAGFLSWSYATDGRRSFLLAGITWIDRNGEGSSMSPCRIYIEYDHKGQSW